MAKMRSIREAKRLKVAISSGENTAEETSSMSPRKYISTITSSPSRSINSVEVLSTSPLQYSDENIASQSSEEFDEGDEISSTSYSVESQSPKRIRSLLSLPEAKRRMSQRLAVVHTDEDLDIEHSEPISSKYNTQSTLQRYERARIRKLQKEEQLEAHKMATISKLLNKQPSKKRKSEIDDAHSPESHMLIEPGTIRWINNSDGSFICFHSNDETISLI